MRIPSQFGGLEFLLGGGGGGGGGGEGGLEFFWDVGADIWGVEPPNPSKSAYAPACPPTASDFKKGYLSLCFHAFDHQKQCIPSSVGLFYAIFLN